MPETKAQFDAITKAHTSLWIGLWVPLDTAETIALPTELYQTAEPPGELHLTLAMCGDVTTLGEEAVAGALEALKVYAKGAAPVEGAVSGIGRFTGGESDVLYASYDAPDLPAFRQGLVDALEHVGVPPLTDHGFSPHITLAYVEKGKGANLFPLGTAPENIPIRFDSLRVGVGGSYYDFALEGRAMEKVAATVRIIQKGEKQRFTLGIVYEPNTVDSQEDWSDEEEIEKACWEFTRALQGKGAVAKAAVKLVSDILKAAESGQTVQLDISALTEEIEKAGGPVNDMHETDFEGELPDIVENYIARSDCELGGQPVKKGSWLMGVIWPADYYKLIESGERTGYSMEGRGRRVNEDVPQIG